MAKAQTAMGAAIAEAIAHAAPADVAPERDPAISNELTTKGKAKAKKKTGKADTQPESNALAALFDPPVFTIAGGKVFARKDGTKSQAIARFVLPYMGAPSIAATGTIWARKPRNVNAAVYFDANFFGTMQQNTFSALTDAGKGLIADLRIKVATHYVAWRDKQPVGSFAAVPNTAVKATGVDNLAWDVESE